MLEAKQKNQIWLWERQDFDWQMNTEFLEESSIWQVVERTMESEKR